jgi:hypothetical protein
MMDGPSETLSVEDETVRPCVPVACPPLESVKITVTETQDQMVARFSRQIRHPLCVVTAQHPAHRMFRAPAAAGDRCGGKDRASVRAMGGLLMAREDLSELAREFVDGGPGHAGS